MRKFNLSFILLAASLSLGAATLQVPVWADGDAISADSISASVDGAPADVVGVRAPADDLMLLVVLDLTDDLAAVSQARNALIERIQDFPGNYYVGVMQAQNGLSVLSEPSADREAAAAAIRNQPVGGRAGLLNTIERAAEIGGSVIEKSGVRLAILYLTDSDIQNYRENYTNDVVNSSDNGDLSRQNSDTLVRERISRMVASLGNTSAPVFISHLTYRTDQLNVAYQTGLIALAGATGGSATISRSIAEIPSAINELVDLIVGHYGVQVDVPAESSKVGINLQSRSGGQLTYRTDYTLAR